MWYTPIYEFIKGDYIFHSIELEFINRDAGEVIKVGWYKYNKSSNWSGFKLLLSSDLK